MSPELRAEFDDGSGTLIDYAEWLYRNVRCGLSHGFAVEWGHIENTTSAPAYASLAADNQPQINQDALVEDFAKAWNQYLDEVLASPMVQLGRNFETRFGAVFHD